MKTTLPKDVVETPTEYPYGSFIVSVDADMESESVRRADSLSWGHVALVSLTIIGAVGYYELGDTVIVKCGCPVTVRYWGQSFQVLFLGVGYVIMRCDAVEESSAEFDNHDDSLVMLLWRIAPWTLVDTISFFLAGVFMNYAFELGTSAYTVTAMASLEPTFIHIIEVTFVGKKSSIFKKSSLVVSGIGVVIFYMASKQDNGMSETNQHRTLGLVSTMLMGAFWSISAVITEHLASDKYYYGRNKNAGPILQQGLLGALTIGLFTWTTRLETPPAPETQVFFSVVIVIAGSTTFLYYTSVAYVSALFVSMSMILCIPINFVVDMVVRGMIPSMYNVLAGVMMLSGFLILQLSPSEHYIDVAPAVKEVIGSEMSFNMDENAALLAPPPPIYVRRESSLSRVTLDSDACDYKIDHYGG